MKNVTEHESIEDFVETANIVKTDEKEEQPQFYFSATVKVLFVRDDRGRERTVNVNAALPAPYITRSIMNDISRAACRRVIEENKIEQDDLRETVIMNISLLGHMLPSMFHDDEDNQPNQAD